MMYMSTSHVISALTTFCEASSASAEERRDVVWTQFNRLKMSPKYGLTIAGVCLKHFQYSEWNGDINDNINLERGANTPDDDAVKLDCAAAYIEVLNALRPGSNNPIPDPTKGATHYHDKTIAPPAWAKADGVVMTLETPKFFFYSNVP